MPEFWYRLHGLALISGRALPSLDFSTVLGAPDATIVIQPTPPWETAAPPPRVELLTKLDYADGVLARSLERVTTGTQSWLVLRFNMDLGLAFTEDGRQVHVFGGLAQDLDFVASCIAGPVASFLRWLRGWPSLHASSVVVDGHVLAVGGQSGAGKSTTIAALASCGHRVFSDEVVGWRSAAQGLVASSGPVQLKLWPDSLAALGIDPGPLPRVRPEVDKRFLTLPEIAQDNELPLIAVYLLTLDGEAGSGGVRELRGAEAFVALKANCRDDSVLLPAMRARQLEALAEMARRVHVREVRAHGGLDRLKDFADVLVEDFRRLLAAAS